MRAMSLSAVLVCVLASCNFIQYERVQYIVTEPAVSDGEQPPAENDGAWWETWLTMPAETVKTLASAPVAIVHEIAGLVRDVVGGVVTIETGRYRKEANWRRMLIGTKHEVHWLDTITTEHMSGGNQPEPAQAK